MASLPIDQLPVKITVNTTIHNGSEKETYELITFGQYYQKTKSMYLRYDEIMEEGTVNTVVKVSGGEGSIMRSGAVKMKLPLSKNKTVAGTYQSPYGLFELNTNASRINHTFDEEAKKGEMDFLYRLKMQGSYAGTYHLSIMFEEDMK